LTLHTRNTAVCSDSLGMLTSDQAIPSMPRAVQRTVLLGGIRTRCSHHGTRHTYQLKVYARAGSQCPSPASFRPGVALAPKTTNLLSHCARTTEQKARQSRRFPCRSLNAPMQGSPSSLPLPLVLSFFGPCLDLKLQSTEQQMLVACLGRSTQQSA